MTGKNISRNKGTLNDMAEQKYEIPKIPISRLSTNDKKSKSKGDLGINANSKTTNLNRSFNSTSLKLDYSENGCSSVKNNSKHQLGIAFGRRISTARRVPKNVVKDNEIGNPTLEQFMEVFKEQLQEQFQESLTKMLIQIRKSGQDQKSDVMKKQKELRSKLPEATQDPNQKNKAKKGLHERSHSKF
mmetsp:Transcript_15381/g.15254  ORF Transcript_15381/g.15254 Transcript_15381/m.15254 type:complete len:187 (-) Transcript_15381:786-1346(-)